jgi:hypothetical protein
MTIPNEELVRKAVITAVDALTTSGKLNPAQQDRFLDYVVDETVLKHNARVIRFRNEQLDIDKIGIGRRAAMPKVEAADPGHRRGITTSKISILPKEIMVPVEISDTFADINLEGEQVKDHIMKMFAKRLGNDMEELYMLGNTLGPAILESEYIDNGSATQYVKDGYLALQDGWSLLANSGHIVDAAGANIGLSIFSQAIRAMPTKFRRNRKDLRWFISPDLAQIYMEKLSTRATALGDSAAGGNGVNPFGIPMVEVPLWPFQAPVTEHITLNGTTAVSLLNAPVSSVVVVPNTLASAPTTAYVEGAGNDYVLDATAGTIARDAAGNIGDGDTVKVTYNANPQVILTHWQNYIVGIGRDIRIEKDRDIFKSVDQYAITAKVGVEIEEVDALVKVRNIGTGV